MINPKDIPKEPIQLMDNRHEKSCLLIRKGDLMTKKTVVVSGINLFQGGTLRVYYNFCDEIIQSGLHKQYHFILFVHKKELFEKYNDYFEILELPRSRKSWFIRMYYEYIYFKKYSKDKDIYLWISIHDSSPRVHAKHQISYFHNPTFSYKAGYRDFKYNKKVFIFSFVYKYVYKWNVKANDFVIVQQDWIARSMSKLLDFDLNKIIVMRADHKIEKSEKRLEKLKPYTFFFPSVSRHFKNFEIICEAVKLLNQNINPSLYQVILTIDGSEDKYAKVILNAYGNLENIDFCGLLPLDEVYDYYQKSSCLIFPSKLETWGLPISEAKEFDLPMIVADLDYAHETVGIYDKVCFFDPDNAAMLANLMNKAIHNEPIFNSASYVNTSPNSCTSWKEVFDKFE